MTGPAYELEKLIDRVEGRSHLLANLLRIAVRSYGVEQYRLGRMETMALLSNRKEQKE